MLQNDYQVVVIEMHSSIILCFLAIRKHHLMNNFLEAQRYLVWILKTSFKSAVFVLVLDHFVAYLIYNLQTIFHWKSSKQWTKVSITMIWLQNLPKTIEHNNKIKCLQRWENCHLPKNKIKRDLPHMEHHDRECPLPAIYLGTKSLFFLPTDMLSQDNQSPCDPKNQA